ncbi:hypothetical protein F2Q70_00026744 [Brassica cretica]|uniref:Uncharacterized protein n=1 Tax=Brassica cretica TaxID=69181 RepID=A0A8S9LBL4_BRACR|nr:hypothetical protein F2Q70_00026744 [Brassica cretica]
MSDGIRGLIGILRGGRSNWSSFDQTRIRTVFTMLEGINRAPLVGGSDDEAEHSQEVIATPSVQAQSSDRLTRQLVRRLSFRTSGSVSRDQASGKSPWISIHDSNDENASGERRSPFSLSPGSGDETVTATRKRCRSSKGVLPGSSRSRRSPFSLSPGSGDETVTATRKRCRSSKGVLPGSSRSRSAGCRLPSLASSAEKEAYAKVAVASSKTMSWLLKTTRKSRALVPRSRGFRKELEVTKREGKKDAEKIEALTEDWRRIHQENEALTTQVVAQKAKITALEVDRDRDIRCASRIARRDIEQRHREILESLKDRWTSKKKEVSAEIRLQEVTANIDLLNELKDGGLTVDAELARLKEMERDCEDLVASAAVPDWSISELDLPQISEDSGDQIGGSFVPVIPLLLSRFSLFGSLRYDEALILIKLRSIFPYQRNMASRRSNPRESDRVQTRTGSANAERIRSRNAKDLEGEKYVARVKSSSPTGSEGRDRPPKKAKTNDSDLRLGVSEPDSNSVAHLVRHFKPAGCPLPSLRNMMEREAYVKMVVAHAKALEANNEFTATLEKHQQDVPRSDELYEIKKVVRELKLGLKMDQDRERANATQLAAAEKLGNQAASLEARLYLDVLVSLKEKWEKKKAATDCEARFREAELDVMAVSDFSVGKLDMPQISEDLPEDFFARVPSAADDVTKCSGGQFEDGEFGIEE